MNMRQESTTSLLTILLCYVTYHTLRVCLFGGKIRWMENFGEKIGKKMGLCVVWLGGGEGKLEGGAQTFSTRAHTKLYYSIWREKKNENACCV